MFNIIIYYRHIFNSHPYTLFVCVYGVFVHFALFYFTFFSVRKHLFMKTYKTRSARSATVHQSMWRFFFFLVFSLYPFTANGEKTREKPLVDIIVCFQILLVANRLSLKSYRALNFFFLILQFFVRLENKILYS